MFPFLMQAYPLAPYNCYEVGFAVFVSYIGKFEEAIVVVSVIVRVIEGPADTAEAKNASFESIFIIFIK